MSPVPTEACHILNNSTTQNIRDSENAFVNKVSTLSEPFIPFPNLNSAAAALTFLCVTIRSLSFLTLCLATIGAYAKPTIRAPCGLEVFLSTPANKVASASEIVVVATVKNVGDKDLNVIELGTVLDNQPLVRPFIVTKFEIVLPRRGGSRR